MCAAARCAPGRSKKSFEADCKPSNHEEPMFCTALLAATMLITGTMAAAQATGRRVQVNGMQMYYEVSGSGEPLIVLHGAYMNIPMMGEIIPQLAKTRRVYALELQGHGRTTDINRPITYQNLADDVSAFMDAVGLKPTTRVHAAAARLGRI